MNTPLLEPGDQQVPPITLRVLPPNNTTHQLSYTRSTPPSTKSTTRTKLTRPSFHQTIKRTLSTQGRPRCLRIRQALSVVTQKNLWYYHVITWIIQTAVLFLIAFASGNTDSGLGLTQQIVLLIVVLEIIEAIMSFFVLSGVLVYIKDQQWHTSDLAWLWLVTTVVFAALYMTIAISYDSLLCKGTQPCTYWNETRGRHHLHVNGVSMPQLSSNVSFEYPDVWLKLYTQNISETGVIIHGATTGTTTTSITSAAATSTAMLDTVQNNVAASRVFQQMRLEMKSGMKGAILLFLQFWYYSVQMQTQVGVGDVIPVCWLARGVAMVQMLIGILFSATLVSLTLDSFRQKRKHIKLARREQLKRLSVSVGRPTRHSNNRTRGIERIERKTERKTEGTTEGTRNTMNTKENAVENNQQQEQQEQQEQLQLQEPAVLPNFNAIFSSDDGTDDEDEEENDRMEEILLDQERRRASSNKIEEDEHGQEIQNQQKEQDDNDSPTSENLEASSTLHPIGDDRNDRNDARYATPTRRSNRGRIPSSHENGMIDSFPPRNSRLSSSTFASSSSSIGWGTWLCGRSTTSYLRAFRRFMRRWLLLVTLAGQATHLFWLYLVDGEIFSAKKHHAAGFVGNTSIALVSMFIQILMVLSVVATALVYVRHSERITLNYLCQAFLSICIHFSGIYIMIFLFQGKSSWPTIGVAEDNMNGDSGGISVRNEGFWGTSMRFMYISIVLMTTTGCNTLSPKSEIAIAAVTVQMIVSFLFLAVILALGVSLVNSERSKSRKEEEMTR